MYNGHCAFSHDALDHRRCNHMVNHRRVLLITPMHRGTDIAPPLETDIPQDISPTLACDRIYCTEVQVLRWT